MADNLAILWWPMDATPVHIWRQMAPSFNDRSTRIRHRSAVIYGVKLYAISDKPSRWSVGAIEMGDPHDHVRIIHSTMTKNDRPDLPGLRCVEAIMNARKAVT